jgi:hypothetical protein
MLMIRPTCPVDYGLCNQTVTVYHYDEEEKTYSTKVLDGVFFEHKQSQTADKLGKKDSDTFLLIVPGSTVAVAKGDKVLSGVGEEISTREAWAALNAAQVPGLAVVNWVAPKYWRGSVVHTEAGG